MRVDRGLYRPGHAVVRRRRLERGKRALEREPLRLELLGREASDRVTPTGRQSFAIDGELSMRGVTRALRLDGAFAGFALDAGGRKHARYEATGSFRRSDYGMAYARGIVGNDVTLSISIDAVDRP